MSGNRLGRGPIRRLAIVNRGEPAIRCLRTIKALREREGIALEAVALFTEVDRDAPYVRHADRSVRLETPRGDTAAWIDHEALVRAILSADCDAAWPGWGFVAESPEFVERLESAGVRFLGPSPAAMRSLGDKIASKEIAEKAGVPVIPWSGSVVADAEQAASAARALGYPVVVKAAAGGGGRGIRVVEEPRSMQTAFESASAEAGSAFGDARLFVERRIEGGRHIEVQIAADAHGIVLALGCRDCSVQRRHQKVLEEAPPPDLSAGLRQRLEEGAVQLAAAVGYEGLGTVEFLVAGRSQMEPDDAGRSADDAAVVFDDAFHLLEMNPRLQVEHGVTEALTGLDLVELQIRIARGESLAGLVVEERGAAIEARVCAEDPDAGFLPAPGRVVRFDPALGPGIRIDSGVAVGSQVPPAFDSLVAKLIASGADREEARARLAASLADFDLVVEGGATNRGWLRRIVDHRDFRRGGVDVGWLDRTEAPGDDSGSAALALVTAAILRYRQHRALSRLNFYLDPSLVSGGRIPDSSGIEIELEHGGLQHRLHVLALGSWRYRVRLDGRVQQVRLREEDGNAARLEALGRSFRVLHDRAEAGIRIELEGRPYRFGFQSAGQVRASAPALVVGIHVASGDRVRRGQRLGLLEAMKVEVGFDAPVDGVVTELRVTRGQQVAAGDVLLVIDPAAEDATPGGTPEAPTRAAIVLPEEPDPLAVLFRAQDDDPLAVPDLAAAAGASAAERRAALAAVRDEVRRVLLGYDADPERTERLSRLLESLLPEGLSERFRFELAEIRSELRLFADVASLFIRSSQLSASGGGGPSNHVRLQMYARRIRAGGAGVAEPFLDLVRAALRHYGISGLEPSDTLERVVFRLLASQRAPRRRDRLVRALVTHVTSLARSGVHLADDAVLAGSLERLASLRGLVGHDVADTAIEARYVIFEGPRAGRLADRASKELEAWLEAAEAEPTAPPAQVLRELAEGPPGVLERVGHWLEDADPRRRAIALAVHARRLYAPEEPEREATHRAGDDWVERLELPGGRLVLAGACRSGQESRAVSKLVAVAEGSRSSHEWPAAFALELFVSGNDAPSQGPAELLEALGEGLPCTRFSVTATAPDGSLRHETYAPSPAGYALDAGLHGVHPSAADRIGLARLRDFELERLPASPDVYGFAARSREVPSDERILVLAEVRSRGPDAGSEARLHVPAFEHVFHEATRTLRVQIGVRDPKRRLQWNRIAIHVIPEVFLDRETVDGLALRLAPETRNLGLEKVLVRLHLLDREHPERPARDVEVLISDVTGQNLGIEWRDPHNEPLRPAAPVERRVADARRRRLVYPYEVVRMLCEADEGADRTGAGLPPGHFEEFDLDPAAESPRAVSVAGRPSGGNGSGVVFGLIRTPTPLLPEGMERVLLLSDPTWSMGSLAAAECDRILAALDLAEARGVPVDWIPISSGARIALDSGTENLDATARVARRIVEWTSRGGTIHVIVSGVNVGAQSYFDALSTMLMHTRGALIMTEGGSMVLTGNAALAASGSVSAEDELAIGGHERVMGPNGQAQYRARDLAAALRILHTHHEYTYVAPGESTPRAQQSGDPVDRDIGGHAISDPAAGFASVGEIFDDRTNPGRKRPFPMRPVMESVIDRDGGHLERWSAWVGAETAIVWDARIGGRSVCLIGIESQPLPRQGHRPADGPPEWNGGTLFPASSKKVARALRSASGNRPVVVLANLSGFDGSPESMRKLQLEHGAEIASAVVEFDGPILFLVVSRYHGGAYVVFSRSLNPRLRAAALEGSYASVIGGSAAATVVFGREVRARAAADPRVRELRARVGRDAEGRGRLERLLAEVTLEKQAEMAAEFDAIHSVERAREVGSLESLVSPSHARAWLVETLAEEADR